MLMHTRSACTSCPLHSQANMHRAQAIWLHKGLAAHSCCVLVQQPYQHTASNHCAEEKRITMESRFICRQMRPWQSTVHLLREQGHMWVAAHTAGRSAQMRHELPR